MTEPANPVLDQLRAIRAEIAELIKGCAHLEISLASIEHSLAGLLALLCLGTNSTILFGYPAFWEGVSIPDGMSGRKA